MWITLNPFINYSLACQLFTATSTTQLALLPRTSPNILSKAGIPSVPLRKKQNPRTMDLKENHIVMCLLQAMSWTDSLLPYRSLPYEATELIKPKIFCAYFQQLSSYHFLIMKFSDNHQKRGMTSIAVEGIWEIVEVVLSNLFPVREGFL